MNTSTFNKLDIEKQIDLTMSEAVFLTQAKKYNLHLYLFQMDQFYIEMYSKEQSGQIISIRAFDEMEHLDIYLQEIDITTMLPVY